MFPLYCRGQPRFTQDVTNPINTPADAVLPAGRGNRFFAAVLFTVVIIRTIAIEIRCNVRFNVVEDYAEHIGVHILKLHLGSLQNSSPYSAHFIHQYDAIHLRSNLEGISHGQNRRCIYNDDIVVFPYLMEKLFEPG